MMNVERKLHFIQQNSHQVKDDKILENLKGVPSKHSLFVKFLNYVADAFQELERMSLQADKMLNFYSKIKVLKSLQEVNGLI